MGNSPAERGPCRPTLNQIDSFTQLAVLAEEKSRREREVGLSFAMATSESWPLQDGDVLRQGLRRGWLVTLKAYETFISACSHFHTRPEKQSLQDYPSPSKGRKRVMGNLAGWLHWCFWQIRRKIIRVEIVSSLVQAEAVAWVTGAERVMVQFPA